jgi:uncharacterized membrane protein YedE/YeeE
MASGFPRRFALVPAGLLLLFSVFLAVQTSGLDVELFLLGCWQGFVLLQCSFGFAGSFRRFFTAHDSTGIVAHGLLLALSTVFLIPAASSSKLFGVPVSAGLGGGSPVSLLVLLGGLLFGLGMSLASCCASGSFADAGSGSLRGVVGLFAFIVGSTIGIYFVPMIKPLFPATEHAVYLYDVTNGSALGGITLSLILILVYVAACVGTDLVLNGRGLAQVLHRKSRSASADMPPSLPGARPEVNVLPSVPLLAGPATPQPLSFRSIAQDLVAPKGWPVFASPVLLFFGQLGIVLVSGGTWGVSGAPRLWGSKSLQLLGVDVAAWTYWGHSPKLHTPWYFDKTSLTDTGIMVGAALSTALRVSFPSDWTSAANPLGVVLPKRTLVATLLGGVCLGVGAVAGSGCNIGAAVSGISVGSVHGWVWMAGAMPGVWLGSKYLRPRFQLHNETARELGITATLS